MAVTDLDDWQGAPPLHQSTIHPTKETNVPDSMIDTRSTPVTTALAALIKALKVEAVDGDFTRTTGFLRRAEDMAQRWQDDRPAHTPRTAK